MSVLHLHSTDGVLQRLRARSRNVWLDCDLALPLGSGERAAPGGRAAPVQAAGLFDDRGGLLDSCAACEPSARRARLAAEVSVAPLRFAANGAHVSILELGIGLGSDFPGLAVSYRVSLLEVGLAF